MPRPCQRRRESAAAQRKSKPNPKPTGPPPIRHKARQKGIHNARRGRGNSRATGRGGRGGQPSRNQRSNQTDEGDQDFISFASNGHNFNVLNGAGSRHDPIALDGDDSLEDGELTDSESDEDDGEDSDMHDAGALTINIEMGRGGPNRAVVMFTMPEAIARYKEMLKSGFPLQRASRERYGVYEVDIVPNVEPLQQATEVSLSQYSRVAFKPDTIVGSQPTPGGTHSSASSYVSPGSASMSRQPSTSTATSGASAARPSVQEAARDYVFDWGAHQGTPFLQVPEQYLRTIGGNPGLLEKHAGVKEAFEYHCPGLRRTAPTKRQLASQEGAPVQAASRGRVQGSRGKANVSWTAYTFPTGAHANKKLNEVSENYLRTIEGMAHVVNKWVGLREALLDYNAKTGRQSKMAP